MKTSFFKRAFAVVLTMLMLVSAVPFTFTSAEEAESSIVYSAVELKNSISLSGLSATKSIYEDETAEKRLLRFSILNDQTVNADNAYISVSLSTLGVNIKDYPFVKIGVRFKTTNNSYVDFNTCLDKYYQSGNTSGSTVSNRLWGPAPSYTSGSFSALNVKYTSYNGCEKSGGYSWDWVANDAIYTEFRIKPFHGHNKAYAGDYLDLEYIGFFKTEAEMNNFVYDTTLVSFGSEPTLTIEVGEAEKMPIVVTPGSAYFKANYVSNNETVAKVTSDGRIIGLSAGTAKITATTTDNKYTADCTVTVTAPANDYSQYIFDRDNLENLKYKLANDKELNVVYLGGSITAGAGKGAGLCWREIVGYWFTDMFPEANITNVNSALGGSGSMLGAFRVHDDVIAHEPDLVFIEFAVNDGYSGHKADGTIPLYYEILLRTLREECPNTEIISLYTVDQADLGSGVNTVLRDSAQLQDAVAAKYGVTGINIGRAMCNAIHTTGSVWSDYVSDSVHPNATGYEVYGNVIKSYLFDKLFINGSVPASLTPHTVPADYADSRTANYKADYVKVSGLDMFENVTGWTHSESKVNTMTHMATNGFIWPSAKENSFTYEFTGTGIAFLCEFAYNPNAVYNFKWSIDGGDEQTLVITDTNHAFNKIAKGGVEASDLDNGPHTLTLKYVGVEGVNETNPSFQLTRFLVSGVKDTGVAGDVNNDSSVDAVDVADLMRNLASWAGYEQINESNADVNGDGKVTLVDGIVLARYIANWSGYETLPIA